MNGFQQEGFGAMDMTVTPPGERDPIGSKSWIRKNMERKIASKTRWPEAADPLDFPQQDVSHDPSDPKA